MPVITGTEGNDILVGTADNDELYGLGGDDIIDGAAGSNVIDAGRGNDRVIIRESSNQDYSIMDGGEGHDIMDLSSMTSRVIVSFSLGGTAGPSPNSFGAVGATRFNNALNFEEVRTGSSFDFVQVSDWTKSIIVRTGAGDDEIYSGSGADTLYGEDGNDRIEAGGGDDYISGGAGNDVIIGGDGNDLIDVTSGADTINGGGGDDIVRAMSVAIGTPAPIPNKFDGGQGFDTFDFSAINLFPQAFWSYNSTTQTISVANYELNNVERLIGTSGKDIFNFSFLTFAVTIEAGSGDDSVTGSSQNDSLYGGAGNDRISGNGGADRLYGEAGDDLIELNYQGTGIGIIDGGDGTDTLRSFASSGNEIDLLLGTARNFAPGLSFSVSGIENVELFGASTVNGDNNANQIYFNPQGIGSGSLVVDGRGGNDVLIGGASSDLLRGGGDDDKVDGGGGEDQLFGDDGNDILIGRSGNDTLNGGLGIDTADYSAAAAGVTARLDIGTASNDGDGGSDTLAGIENLTGSAFDDLLFGNATANVLQGGLGRDTILGLGGDDILIGGAGAVNELYGGTGDDRYVLSVVDTIIENANEGIDTVETSVLATYSLGSNFDNLTYSGSAAFTGIGNALNNVMTGGTGNDVLTGAGGNDTLNGGLGIDTADYSAAAAGITARLDIGAASNDGDGGSDTLAGIENLTGSTFDDLLFGNATANVLQGGLGRDTILGLGGDDTIMGGAGAANELYGGVGDDTYVVENRSDSIVENAGEGTDTVLSALFQINLSANVERLTYTGTGSFTGVGNGIANVITGGTQRDVLLGLGGDDILIGGTGAANELYGGAGDDTYIMDVGDTVIEGVGDGTDTVHLRGLQTLTLGANVENLSVIGTGNYVANGNALNNVMTGGTGNDVLTGAGGNDTLVGGLGTDTAVLSGLRADYTITAVTGGWTVRDNTAGRDGTDTLTGIEQLRFSDGTTFALGASALSTFSTAVLINEDEYLLASVEGTPFYMSLQNVMDDFGVWNQDPTLEGNNNLQSGMTFLGTSYAIYDDGWLGHTTLGQDFWYM